jgi:hypothetical protein
VSVSQLCEEALSDLHCTIFCALNSTSQILYETAKSGNFIDSLEFEVFTALTVKNAVYWDVKPCRFIIYRRFRGTCPTI